MKKATCLVFVLVLFAAICVAQDAPQGSKHPFVPKEYPIEHTSVDEMVSLSSGTPFAQAMFIISKFSNKFEKKVIIDPIKHKGNISVDIENMHWKKAFEMILRANGLWYVSYETYYEVVEPVDEVATAKPKTDDTKKSTLTENTREVRIKATFFEGDRHFLHELGIDWRTIRAGSLNVDARSAGHQKLWDSAVYNALETYSAGFERQFGSVTIQALLDTLESAEKGRIIATPEVVVMVGKSAKVLVGQEFAVNTRDFAGNIVTEFYETGTIMEVVPTVFTDRAGKEFIHLAVSVIRSSLSDPVNLTINKTEANSSILLNDGEDTAIAGLYSTERKVGRSGVPLLKDLPWWVLGLRYVFGFDRVEKQDKELVILLNAQLVPKLNDRIAQEEGASDFDKLNKELNDTVKPLWNRPGDGSPSFYEIKADKKKKAEKDDSED
ncbi:MAG: type II and III secretion system protein [Candidatus Coatesbacteria bacterium]|nr:type II and III secretion system protein [Candidatus Coatesbacteria bacterium]